MWLWERFDISCDQKPYLKLECCEDKPYLIFLLEQ